MDQGPGWVKLRWKAPVEGGKVQGYRVERRVSGETAWSTVDLALVAEAFLGEQPRGVSLEYSVRAVNKTGEGDRGNLVEVVL